MNTEHVWRRVREWGVGMGVMMCGEGNAITDVAGVRVGQVTRWEGDSVRTGVTAIVPHGGNLFQEKVAGGIYVGNGFGKLAGGSQVEELGQIESPIVLTNTLGVAAGIEGVVEYTLRQKGNESVQSVNAVVGETNDGWLNDIRGRHVRAEDVLRAIESATSGPVEEGCVGAGCGTVCFGWKGGIGTASRVLPAEMGGYVVGAIVQTNFGGVLQVEGVPVGREMGKYSFWDELMKQADGSCMMVIATDAPLDGRNLRRLAKRGFMGMARTGGIASNGSGDYVIAFSTAESVRVMHGGRLRRVEMVGDDYVSPVFMAGIEAVEEAIIGSLFAAVTTSGKEGRCVEALPVERVISILKRDGRIQS